MKIKNTLKIIKRKFHKPIIKRDVFSYYSNIIGEETGFGLKLTDKNVPARSMTWVIPDFEASSGGHINIFRMVKLLKARGFEHQHIIITDPNKWSSAQEAKTYLTKSFGDIGASVSLGIQSLVPTEYLVATSWKTAYWVAKYRDTKHRCYFVQDFEPYFYPVGDEYFLAENTYRLGLHGITAGTWLSTKLKAEYGMDCHAYSFSYDRELYRRTEKKPRKFRNVFFYARPVTARRCFDTGLLVLEKVCKAVPDAAVVLAGWNVANHEIPFHHLNAGSLKVTALADLYTQCEVALVLSGTNLSLLPMEIAACGCPLVLNNGASSSWLFDPSEVEYCDMDVDKLADAVIGLLRDPQRAEDIAKKAMVRAQKSDWDGEADSVAAFLKQLKVPAT